VTYHGPSLVVANSDFFLHRFFGVFGMYYSLQYLPLADCTVLTFLAPGLVNETQDDVQNA
jgi:hypothetical protein